MRQRAHLVDQVRLALEPDPGKVRQRDVPVFHPDAIGESAVRLEQVGIRFVAAESEAGSDRERHLMPTVGDAPRRRPAMLPQHVQRAQILDQSVAQGAVELQPIAVWTHAGVANKVARILHREQVFAGGHAVRVMFRELGLQLVIQWIAGLLVPEQWILR